MRRVKQLRRVKTAGLLLLPATALLAAALALLQAVCPSQGAALTRRMREFARLKNRSAPPARSDFDERVTLESLLRPGADSTRWSESRAAAVEGYVLEVTEGGMESANCYSPLNHDVHIHLATRPDATPRERLVLEVTPRLTEWARSRGLDWSAPALRRDLVGRRCRFEGWLLFDAQHADESENTAPSRPGNWRATAWELHPVTDINVRP